jgi:voltage-gated potassium channel
MDLWMDGMDKLQKRWQKRPFVQWLKSVWPLAPLGLLLFTVGAVNVLTGLRSQGFRPAYQIMSQIVSLSDLTQDVSLGILGSGVQIMLGTGMLGAGILLFWRSRSAWAFSVLLLVIAIVVDLFSGKPMTYILFPGLSLASLLIWENRFDRRSKYGGYLLSFISLVAVFAYGVLGSMLIGNMFQPAIHDLGTALYFTVVTLSTVGSYIYPATPEAQIFMVSLILGGISIFTTTIVTTLGPLLSNHINPILTGRKIIARPNAHVVLIGASPFARNVALELARQKISFVQVLPPKSSPPLNAEPIIHGDPNDMAVLEQAGVQKAKIVVVAGSDDEVNATTALTIKNMSRKAQVIIVASSSQAVPRLRLANANLVYSPAAVGARLLTDLINGVPMPLELQNLLEQSV